MPVTKLRKSHGLNGKSTYFENIYFKSANAVQSKMLTAIETNILTIGYGSAGTGKTTIAAVAALRALASGKFKKLIFLKPPVETGHGLGFLPGSVEEKISVYAQSTVEIIKKFIPGYILEELIEEEKIEIAVLNYERGKNYDECFVVFDEAQNASPREFFLLLSRIFDNSKLVIVGDSFQSDIRNSGLQDCVERLRNLENVECAEFLPEHSQRGQFTQSVIRAYGG